MPLPTDRPLSFSEMRDYFKANGAISLSQLYRGGDLVPDIPENSHVPTFGQISRSDLAGAYRLSNLVTSEVRETVRYSKKITYAETYANHNTSVQVGRTILGYTWKPLGDWIDWSSTEDEYVATYSYIYSQRATWATWNTRKTVNIPIYYNTTIPVNTLIPV